MHVRRFVLVPLVELEPNLTHPSLGLTMSELLAQLPEDGQEVGLTED
jgi:7,8-dihydro-6-hydroxymethylpterin-pyrophosphokinase